MNKKETAIQQLLQQKLLPLFYHDDAGESIALLQSLYDAGIRILEYTNRGAHALANFKEMRKAATATMPGLLLGIGTIKNEAQAQSFMDAGADFIVCPTIHSGVAKLVHNAGLFWIPGCMTPTEIAAAESAGATIVKIFPGNILGPSYISSIKELFPAIKFMPTGGVEATMDNLKSWFGAGVVAVGMGSKLVTNEIVAEKNYGLLKKLAEDALRMVQQF